MSPTLVGLIGIGGMVALLLLGVPIALAMAVTGGVGLWVLEGPGPALAHTLLIPWDEGRSFVFVTIPLFVLMGQLVFQTGLASDLYQGVRTWIGRVPGGMAITSVMACGAFGAVTGSSIATVATMGRSSCRRCAATSIIPAWPPARSPRRAHSVSSSLPASSSSSMG